MRIDREIIVLKPATLALAVAVASSSAFGATKTVATKPARADDLWAGLAEAARDTGFKALPILATTRSLGNEDLPEETKRQLLRRAVRLSTTPGTVVAARELAEKIPDPSNMRDWEWHAGLAALERGDATDAAVHFAAVNKKDNDYLRARYQLGVIAYSSKRPDDAEAIFKEILDAKPAPSPDLEDLAKLALGRLWYERKKFQSAAAIYRTVSRDGATFPVALFEQSWAFFMAGFPNHALGALHGVESPFFEDRFNPESTLLRSVILYWMCLYRDSEQALGEFIARHSGPMDQLGNFLARQQLTTGSAWELLENLDAGVSGESLGIPRNVLLTAANSDRMIAVRTAIKQVTRELKMVEDGKLGDGSRFEVPAASILRQHLQGLRAEAGKKYIAALTELGRQYDELRAQADFLYVELLTSEKDLILGKEHLVSDKFTGHANQGKRPAGWGKRVLAWAPDNKHEYWWDEVGFYIDPARPACKK